MYLLMFIAVILFLILSEVVFALRKKAESVRVSELWKLFLGLVLMSIGSGMSTADDVSLKLPKIGMLALGLILTVWFVAAIWKQWRSAKR